MANLLMSEIVAPAKKQISVIWDYFGIQKDEEDSIICRSCLCSVTAKKWLHFKLTSTPQN